MKKKIITIVTIISIILVSLGLYVYSIYFSPASFEITFLDVGQADAIVVECGNEYMMVDGGNNDDSSFIYSYLESNNINHIKYMIATHPDEDHIGGLSGALNYASVDTVYCPVTSWDTWTFNNFKKYVELQNKTIEIPKVNEIFYIGSAKVEVLAVNTYLDESNNQSIVLKITYKNNTFLLMADAEYDVEKYLTQQDIDLKADLLKVGHHGSNSSTNYIFLHRVNPSISIISVGLNNDYGHPSDKVIKKLEDINSTIYRTDLNGTIKCKSDGNNITCELEKNN